MARAITLVSLLLVLWLHCVAFKFPEQSNNNSLETSSRSAERRKLPVLSSEEQELLLLDALHQKSNSSNRGFEASLADLLGKSECSFFLCYVPKVTVYFHELKF